MGSLLKQGWCLPLGSQTASLSVLKQENVIYFLHRLSHSLIRLDSKELLFFFCCSLGTKKNLMPYMVPTPSHLPTYLPPSLPFLLIEIVSPISIKVIAQTSHYIILYFEPILIYHLLLHPQQSHVIPRQLLRFSQFCPKMTIVIFLILPSSIPVFNIYYTHYLIST